MSKETVLKIIFVLLFPILSGCVQKAEISANDQNKIMECTDFRDGEVFSFNTSNVDVFIGVGSPSYIKFEDLNGIKRTLKETDEQFIKCKEVGYEE